MPDVDTQGAVESAFDQLSAEGGDDAGAAPVETDRHSGDHQEARPGDRAEGESADVGATAADQDAQTSRADRARDAAGRFAKEKARKAAAEAAQAKPDEAAPVADPAAPVVPAASAAPELKPPQDWRAAAKEKWKELPRVVQEENLRTYAETRKVLDENANLRKATEPLRQTFAQHEQVLRASGAPVHQVVGSLLRTLGVLQTGTMQQRADVIAYLQRTHLGTDEQALTLLGRALDASGTGQPVQAPQALTHEQIRDLVRQERQAAEQQDARQGAIRAWQDFEGSNPEFLAEPGIRGSIRELVMLWQQDHPGEAPSKDMFQKLYDRACQLNEGVAKVQQQRKAAAEAKAKASTPAAAAAAGIKSEPTGPAGQGKTKSTLDEVARQYDRLSRPARV